MMLVLFGAGASYGSDVDGTPPLGNDQLFMSLRAYNPDGWGSIPLDMTEVFKDDFEVGMTKLAKEYPFQIAPLQRAMAAYFFNFVPSTTNLYVKLGQRIQRSEWRGALCSLNYDRLLEVSILQTGLNLITGTNPKSMSQIELCLPHGCCHLFCDSVRGTASGVTFTAMNIGTSGKIRTITNPDEHRTRIQQDAFPPVMSYYEPQKRTTSGQNFIDTQRKRWSQLATDAERIAVVGVRVRPRDKHIWEPLAKTSATILYCSGPGNEEYEEWANLERSMSKDVVLRSYFSESFEEICDHLGM